MGEYFFWYRLTRVVLDKGPLNGRVCVLLYSQSFLHHVVTAKFCITLLHYANSESVVSILPVNSVAQERKMTMLSSVACLYRLIEVTIGYL